jgi:hypothetical protein
MDFNSRISHAYYRGSREDLYAIQIELLNLRQKTGEFIDRFLDEYDGRMATGNANGDSLWKLFRKKHVEYGEAEQCLRNLDYFLKK